MPLPLPPASSEPQTDVAPGSADQKVGEGRCCPCLRCLAFTGGSPSFQLTYSPAAASGESGPGLRPLWMWLGPRTSRVSGSLGSSQGHVQDEAGVPYNSVGRDWA